MCSKILSDQELEQVVGGSARSVGALLFDRGNDEIVISGGSASPDPAAQALSTGPAVPVEAAAPQDDAALSADLSGGRSSGEVENLNDLVGLYRSALYQG